MVGPGSTPSPLSECPRKRPCSFEGDDRIGCNSDFAIVQQLSRKCSVPKILGRSLLPDPWTPAAFSDSSGFPQDSSRNTRLGEQCADLMRDRV